jgi:hypothetical protein
LYCNNKKKQRYMDPKEPGLDFVPQKTTGDDSDEDEWDTIDLERETR